MEELSEVEVIKMEDEHVVAPAATSTLIETGDENPTPATTPATAVAPTASDPQDPDHSKDAAVLPAITATSIPEVIAGPFNDEDTTFQKVYSFCLLAMCENKGMRHSMVNLANDGETDNPSCSPHLFLLLIGIEECYFDRDTPGVGCARNSSGLADRIPLYTQPWYL